MKNIKVQLLFLCIHFLCITNSNASNKDAKSFKETQDVYECLPEIAIPGIRKIIGEYAHNILMYRVQYFTNLRPEVFLDFCAGETLSYATAKCITSDDGKHSIIMTPEDKQQSPLHIICDKDNFQKPLPLALQSDSTFNQLYKPSVQYKSSGIYLSIVFARFGYPFGCQKLDGNHDCIDCVPDDQAVHVANLIANSALEKARFIEHQQKEGKAKPDNP